MCKLAVTSELKYTAQTVGNAIQTVYTGTVKVYTFNRIHKIRIIIKSQNKLACVHKSPLSHWKRY